MLNILEQYLIWGSFVALLLPMFCYYLIEKPRHLKSKAPKKEAGFFVLKIHSYFTYIGLSIFLFSFTAMLFLILLEQQLGGSWLFIIPLTLGLFISLQSLMVQVRFNEKTIQYRNTLGQVREYEISDLQFESFNPKMGWQEYRTSSGDKIRFPLVLSGMPELTQYLNQIRP